MAVDLVELRRLLGVTRAASVQHLQAANVQNKVEAKRQAEIALQALQDALVLDPTRSSPAWRDGTPRAVSQVGDGSIGYYIRYIARMSAAGL